MRRIAVACVTLAAAALAAPAAQAQGGQRGSALPDGRYTCQIWIGSMLSSLGKVDIKGRSYRGPSHTPSGAFKPLKMDGAGNIDWSPKFSQLSATGATINGSRVSGTAAKPAFEIDYTTARGYKESMECTRE